MRPAGSLVSLLWLVAACAGSDRVATDGQGPSVAASQSTTSGVGGETGSGGDQGNGGTPGSGGDGSSSAGGAGAGDPASGGSGGGGAGPVDVCGDGAVTGIEECDDGNSIDDDGCSSCVVDCEPGGAKAPATGHCYRLFPDATNWPFAEANCAAWGGSAGLGHLVSIADADEQELVFGLIEDQTWIGIQDPLIEGEYEWSDGSVWDYEFWAEGEPDNTNEEDCAFMRPLGGGWNDHACGDIRPAYLCERRAAGTF